MTVDLASLDAHEQVSDELRGTWKLYAKADHSKFVDHPDIDDLHVPEKAKEFCSAGHIPSEKLVSAFRSIEGEDWNADQVLEDAPIYFHPLLPGRLLPSPAMRTPLLKHSRLAHCALPAPPEHPESISIPYGP
jgi:hypothetical protein